ncbi:hypothetical protein ABWW58_15280 [Sporolactobacillus sp. STCC-11]|uniref:hypothetical protein n=1 Tax=Sporolactobacillus caesalpiniae TaxID=3230362 RepID=UPI00339A906F
MIRFSVVQVPIETIDPLYFEFISEERLSEMVRRVQLSSPLEHAVWVERKENPNGYWLVDNYADYMAYKQCGYSSITCLCRPRTSQVRHMLELLRDMYS